MIYLGTLGWDYSFWNKDFYPKNIVKKLPHYSKISAFTELRSTYDSIPSEDKVLGWNSGTPDDFMFVSPMLRDVTFANSVDADKITEFFSAMEPLGNKHQMTLLHFPRKMEVGEETIPFVTEMVEEVAGQYSGQVLLDLPHYTWNQETSLRDMLRKHSACLVGEDSRPISSLMRDPSVYYLRLVGDTRTVPKSEFGNEPLDRSDDIKNWADHIDFIKKSTDSIFVAIDNHFSGNAISDAYELSKELRKRDIQIKGFEQS